jgi:phytoene desaturase
LAKQAIVIGAGIGGIAASIRLQLKGYQVQVLEKNAYPGGKLSEIELGGYRFDAGPSLFTLPEQVEELFRLAGKNPQEHFAYERLEDITHYFYPDGLRLTAWRDLERFAAEAEAKTGEPREHLRSALRKSERLYALTKHVFLERSLHRLSTYLRRDTLYSILHLYEIDALRSMDRANRSRFRDPRLVQLFNRYATYNGSNPWQAPATLNIIPYLEYGIGAFFPKGGMYAITLSLFRLAQELGVEFRFGEGAKRIRVEGKAVQGVESDRGFFPAEVVVSNADVAPTYRLLLPDQQAPEHSLRQPRSSSALIFYWGIRRSFPELGLHNIFFSGDYAAEFQALWQQKSLHPDPTVYVNISSKHHAADAPPGCENWFVMINAPANQGQDWDQLIREARAAILAKLSQMLGVSVAEHIACEALLDPRSIESRTSSWQGALYGTSSNNPFAAFLRHPNFSRRIRGLYFCGGSVHPGGGIPLSLLSAKIVGEMVN